MGNYLYDRGLEAEWQEQKYLRMDDFLSQKDKVDLRNAIGHLEEHGFCNKVKLMNRQDYCKIKFMDSKIGRDRLCELLSAQSHSICQIFDIYWTF